MTLFFSKFATNHFHTLNREPAARLAQWDLLTSFTSCPIQGFMIKSRSSQPGQVFLKYFFNRVCIVLFAVSWKKSRIYMIIYFVLNSFFLVSEKNKCESRECNYKCMTSFQSGRIRLNEIIDVIIKWLLYFPVICFAFFGKGGGVTGQKNCPRIKVL